MSRVIYENEIGDQPIEVPQNEKLFYIKLVGIGPQSLADKHNIVSGIVKSQPGFFVAGAPEETRKVLHGIVDAMCDAAKLP